MTNQGQQEIDPSIYQYDEIYDQIKGEGRKDKERERSRSREKKKKQQERPKESKYINKMKQIVATRQKDHEVAYQKKIKRENQKLGVNDDMVFVTQSFLKKKEEEKQAEKRRKLEEQTNLKDAPQKLDYTGFKKKMLDQATTLYKK